MAREFVTAQMDLIRHDDPSHTIFGDMICIDAVAFDPLSPHDALAEIVVIERREQMRVTFGAKANPSPGTSLVDRDSLR
jgi:hypothetical protein